MSRTVRDSVLMFDALHGPGVGDMIIVPPPSQPYAQAVEQDPGPLRIRILDSRTQGESFHDDCVEAVRKAAAALESGLPWSDRRRLIR